MSDVTIDRREYEKLLEDRRRLDLIELHLRVPRWNMDAMVDGLGIFGTFRQAVDEMERRIEGRRPK